MEIDKIDYDKTEKYTKSIHKEWERFIEKGVVGKEVIKPIVLESWKRSKEWGVNPKENTIIPLDGKELDNKLKENQELIKTSSPLLEILARSVRGSGFRIDLFNKDVYILKQWGDRETLENSRKLGSFPGACKSERLTGTNAIGLASYLKIPIQLIGPEHYNVRLHQWTCSAAPIKDIFGNILGIINMTGNYKLIHKHTLGMVIATARAIENQIRQDEVSKRLETENKYVNASIESNFDAVLIIDEKGRIVRTNRAVEEMFGLPIDAILNQNCEDIFGINNPLIQVLDKRKEINEEEVSLKINGRDIVFYSTIRPIFIESHELKGAVAFFREIKTVRRIAKRYSTSKAKFTFEDLIGRNKEFIKAITMAKKVANSSVKVLLEGKTGTGKELFAQAIHNLSSRRNKPLVAINCAAIPLELMESELFGYEEGAFTGARRGGLLGKIELAEGGTFFLDEISSMPLVLQGKLLRVLETGVITRIGGRREIVTDVRIISATNKDLLEELRKGNFREDLFYRINLVTIKIPPLRERGDDISLLIEYFYNRKDGKNLKIESIAEDKALQILLSYWWPGNIRELENVIERALLFSSGDKIKVKDLPPYLMQIINKEADLNLSGGEIKKLEELEKESIIKALKISDGNITLASQQLGIARNTFYVKMKKHGISRKNF
jgi:PAS domain S-box-containing protein